MGTISGVIGSYSGGWIIRRQVGARVARIRLLSVKFVPQAGVATSLIIVTASAPPGPSSDGSRGLRAFCEDEPAQSQSAIDPRTPGSALHRVARLLAAASDQIP